MSLLVGNKKEYLYYQRQPKSLASDNMDGMCLFKAISKHKYSHW